MIRPTRMQRARAYLRTGSLPPLSAFRAPLGKGDPQSRLQRRAFRAPRISVSTIAAGYVAAVALGGFGLGLMIAGAAL